jgi:hypothetical protein
MGTSVQLHARPPNPQGKSCRYQLHRRLGEPQWRSGSIGAERNILLCQESKSDHPEPNPALYQPAYDYGRCNMKFKNANVT